MERHGGSKLRRSGGRSQWLVRDYSKGEHGADGVPPGLLHIFMAKCCGTSVGFSLEWVRQKVSGVSNVCVYKSPDAHQHMWTAALRAVASASVQRHRCTPGKRPPNSALKNSCRSGSV